jgi:hypothetical protein
MLIGYVKRAGNIKVAMKTSVKKENIKPRNRRIL